MTIKDFKIGQTAFAMGGYRTPKNKFLITEAEVVKVGRKYVTISGNWGTQFKETASSSPYLIERCECGTPRLLFTSREAADRYIEREELKTWVREATGWYKIERYPLEKLRAVKKILEEATNHE